MRFDWRAAIGGIAAGSDPEFVDKVRRRIQARVEQTSVRHYKRRHAEKRIEAAACEAIVETFAESRPERRWYVTPDWPRAFVMIADGEAVVEPWLGMDWLDDGDGIEPVKVPVDFGRQPPGVVERIRNALPWVRKPLDLTEPAPAAKPQDKSPALSSTMQMLMRKSR